MSLPGNESCLRWSENYTKGQVGWRPVGIRCSSMYMDSRVSFHGRSNVVRCFSVHSIRYSTMTDRCITYEWVHAKNTAPDRERTGHELCGVTTHIDRYAHPRATNSRLIETYWCTCLESSLGINYTATRAATVPVLFACWTHCLDRF